MVGTRPQQARGAEDDWDESEEDPGPSYTWLHYVILVVVAFVLGLLIWKLVLDEGSSSASDQAVGLVTSVPSVVGLA